MIPLAVPNLTGKEAEYTAEAIASGHVGPDGPFVERFEAAVAHASGRRWAVATITGTAALHAAMAVCGFSGRSVPTGEHCYPAARNVLRMLNALGGEQNTGENHDFQPYGFQPWPIVADRAPAIGEEPSETTVECYSFAANKTVTTGQGGAMAGDDRGLEEAVRAAIHQGYRRNGFANYRMPNLAAAVGCAQMERLDEFREAKKRIWNRYAEHFEMVERGASRWMATMFPGRDGIIAALTGNNIEYREEPFGGISLPCSTALTEDEQDQVIRAVVGNRNGFGGTGRRRGGAGA